MRKSQIQNTTKSPREFVESSAVWKWVRKSYFQNTTKSPREFVESSVVKKTVRKSQIQNTTKSPREFVESSAVWKTVRKSYFQNTTKSPRELVVGNPETNHVEQTHIYSIVFNSLYGSSRNAIVITIGSLLCCLGIKEQTPRGESLRVLLIAGVQFCSPPRIEALL